MSEENVYTLYCGSIGKTLVIKLMDTSRILPVRGNQEVRVLSFYNCEYSLMEKYNFNRAMGDTIRQVALGQKQKYTPAECIESMLRNIEIKIVVRVHIFALAHL